MSFDLIPTAVAANSAAQVDGMNPITFIVLMSAVFYFLMIRPQSKRTKEHETLLKNVSVGDEITTNGGVMGKIAKVADDYVMLSVSKDVQLRLQKQAISQVLPKGTLKLDKS